MVQVKQNPTFIIIEPQTLLACGLSALLRAQYPTLSIETHPYWERAVVDRHKAGNNYKSNLSVPRCEATPTDTPRLPKRGHRGAAINVMPPFDAAPFRWHH